MIISTLKKQAANVLTFSSMIIGLFSILNSIEGNFKKSAVLILIAAVFDYFDGLVARKLNISSSFGKYLDSNADLIAFGVAPGLLVYLSVLIQFDLIGILVSFLFISAGVFRLARYNATEFSGRYVGIPITIAGALLAISTLAVSYIPTLVYIPITLILSYLMASRLSFKKV